MTSGIDDCRESPSIPELHAPPSVKRLVGFVGAAFVLGVGLTLWLSNSRTERFFGYVNAVNETVTAGRHARITKLLVKPGQIVVPGTPLLTLQDAALESARLQQQQAIAALEAELRQAQARASVEIADRKAKLEGEIFQTQLTLASLEEKRFDHRLSLLAAENRVTIAMAEERLSEVQIASVDDRLPFKMLTVADAGQPKARKRDFLYELQERETTRNKLEVSEAHIEFCEQRLTQLKKQIEGAPAQINEAFGVNVIQTRLASAQATLAKLDAETPALTVSSVKHGTVGSFMKTAGEIVGSHDTIVELFDADQPYILAEIPTRHLLDFPAGREVALEFPGGMQRQGIVSELPPQAAELPGPHDRLSEREGRLRLRVLPKGQVWPQVPFGTYIEVRAASTSQTIRAIPADSITTTGRP